MDCLRSSSSHTHARNGCLTGTSDVIRTYLYRVCLIGDWFSAIRWSDGEGKWIGRASVPLSSSQRHSSAGVTSGKGRTTRGGRGRTGYQLSSLSGSHRPHHAAHHVAHAATLVLRSPPERGKRLLEASFHPAIHSPRFFRWLHQLCITDTGRRCIRSRVYEWYLLCLSHSSLQRRYHRHHRHEVPTCRLAALSASGYTVGASLPRPSRRLTSARPGRRRNVAVDAVRGEPSLVESTRRPETARGAGTARQFVSGLSPVLPSPADRRRKQSTESISRLTPRPPRRPG